MRNAARWPDNDLVFTTQLGTPLDAANVRRAFRHVAEHAGLLLEEWTPQELRHSFVSLQSSAGIPIEDIAHLVAHMNTRTTEKVYRKELLPVLRRGAKMMDDLFKAHHEASEVRRACSARRPTEGSRRTRQHQHRLTEAEVDELAHAYRKGARVRDLSQRFRIHRVTVTAQLRRHGVTLRHPGLTTEEVTAAAGLYVEGWSLARLGERFGVDAATVWRALRATDVEMRMPSQRPARSE